MSTKRINVTTILPPSALFIGYVAENGVTNVEFDVSAWVTMYGSGTATLIMKRWGDANPYPIALAVDNEGLATWTISATDTAKTGFAYAQLRYEAGTKVKKSPIYTLKIGKSLGSPAETPDQYEDWIDALTHLAAQAMAEALDIEDIPTDKTLTIDGGIADAKKTGDEIAAVKADLDNATNESPIDFFGRDAFNLFTDGTNHSVTFTKGDGIVTANGTATGGAAIRAFIPFNALILPSWVIPEESLRIYVNTSDTNLRFCIAFLDSNGNYIGPVNYITAYRALNVPENTATVAMFLNVAQGSTVTNATISIKIYKSIYDLQALNEVAEKISENEQAINDIDTENAITRGILTRTSYGRSISDNEGALVTADNVTTLYLSNVRLAGKYIITSNNVVDGAPEGFRPEYIIVDNLRDIQSNAFLRQTIGQIYNRPDIIYYRLSKSNGAWGAWQLMSGTHENNYTYNNQNTFNQAINQNTYNVTAEPTITAENLYYLTPTNDNTDRTVDIATMLSSNGVCRLGSGTYYVANLQMPDNSMILGCGASTIIRLVDSVTDGYAIRMSKKCTIKDCMIRGSENYTPMVESAVNAGSRVGILWSGEDDVYPNHGIIDNVRIEHFNGSGIKCTDTTVAQYRKLFGSNLYIEFCDIGINLAYLTEFNQFSNCMFRMCYHGVINNGGNNSFTNCEFVQNVIHFLIDNSSGTLVNTAHCGISNCIFGHAYGFVNGELVANAGIAYKVVGIPNGYVFNSCYNGYGATVIEDSQGIMFNSCMWSAVSGSTANNITITRGGGITFNACVLSFLPTLTITDNTDTEFVGCRLKDGTHINV